MEGKTFISSNLAVTMARMGRKVILIDADMRKPAANRLFDLSLKPGLSDLVSGKCRLREAMRNTPVKLLKVIPAGNIPANPAELLTGKIMMKLLDYLKHYFDYVILDTPPILAVTDAAVLSATLDGTVLIVKASETTREAAKRALEQVKSVRARALGVVLNQVDFRREQYYYSYYYKNQYYYSEEGEKRVRRVRTERVAKRPPGKKATPERSRGLIGY
jgi:capsular exopolysaccharide synthesis family protein